ncbi:MAG: amidase family protein, partial [bacterium]|nr:amidase family protein [bacterium]
DAAHLLQVLAGPDPNDPLCSTAPTSDYLLNHPLDPPPRIGLVRTYFLEEADETMHETVDLATEAFRSAGAKVIDVVLPKRFKHIHNRHRLIMYAEAAAYHADRFENQPEKFQPGIRELVQEGLFLPAVAYADARQHQITLRHEIRQVFKNVDVLLTPATPAPAPEGLESTGDPAFNSPWTYTGLPTISLPVTLTSENLPTAIQLIGPAFEESHLLQAAAWCESQLCFDAVPCL